MSTPRDPRVDPRPGDVLMLDDVTRQVTGTEERFVTYSGFFGTMREKRGKWRRWAKQAEVKVTAV